MTERGNEFRSTIELPVLDEEGSRWGKAHHVLLGFFILAVVIWLLSGFYKVNADEVAIVERLGQFVSASGGEVQRVEQGLHYRMPWPIDRVLKIPIAQTRTLTVNTFFAPQEAYADFKRELMRQSPDYTPQLLNSVFDPYLITGDKNVVHISIAVTYRIVDPVAWITTVSHEAEDKAADSVAAPTPEGEDMREQLFQQIVQHAMVRQLAVLPIDRVLFSDTEAGGDKWRVALNNAVQGAMLLPDPSDPTGKRKIDLGVEVQNVVPTAVHWPTYQQVDEAFQNVLNSKSQADVARFQAKTQAQSAVTQATSQKETMVREAQAYAKQVTDTATGEASRFQQVFQQFEKAPDVTRWNVYAEAVRAVSGAATRTYFVQPGQRTMLTIDPPVFDASQGQNGQNNSGGGPPPGGPGR